MKKLRVIQLATGKVGEHALRAILDDPRLDLVGVYVYSADKVGMDAGQLCSRPPCGVLASNDLDQILLSRPDVAIYTPMLADVSQVEKLLENGVDVISTNLFSNVGGVQGEVRQRLESACERGNSSFHVTGVHPGWANALAVSLTGVCRRVDCVSLYESADCSEYESPETWLALGMSLPEATAEVESVARMSLQSFADATQRMAEAMSVSLDELRFGVEFAKASARTDLGWLCLERGTIAAIRGGWDGIVNGRTVVRTRVAWYLTDRLEQDWHFDDDHYHLVVDGDPGVECRVRFIPQPDWQPNDTLISTALPAIHAIFNVHDAPAGILGLKDAGLIAGASTVPVF
ncbi:MAG TPA: hypothetical protein VIK82_07065 [Porticoccaceae bacterium]